MSARREMIGCQWVGACRAAGGLEAERAQRQQAQAEEEEQQRTNFESLQRVRQEGFRKARAPVFYGESYSTVTADAV